MVVNSRRYTRGIEKDSDEPITAMAVMIASTADSTHYRAQECEGRAMEPHAPTSSFSEACLSQTSAAPP